MQTNCLLLLLLLFLLQTDCNNVEMELQLAFKLVSVMLGMFCSHR